MLKPNAVTDSRIGEGVGMSLYQCHHSRPTNAIKKEGVITKGSVSLANVCLIFLRIFRPVFRKKEFDLSEMLSSFCLIILKRNRVIGLVLKVGLVKSIDKAFA